MLVEHIVDLLLQMRKTDAESYYKSTMDCSLLFFDTRITDFSEFRFVSYHLYMFDIQPDYRIIFFILKVTCYFKLNHVMKIHDLPVIVQSHY